MNLTLADIFHFFGTIFFIVATLYLLGAATMSVF